MTAQPPLAIFWIRHDEMTPAQVEEYDRLDAAAFSPPGETPDPDAPPEEWDSVDVHCFGLLGGRMVSHAGLVERDILIGGRPFITVGVGGVCTHPDFQRRGYARVVMDEIRAAILADPRAQLGLLFCAPQRVPFYASLGWVERTGPLYALQFGERVRFGARCMLLLKPGVDLPPGEIDLRNIPW